jgi:hypothetical protein
LVPDDLIGICRSQDRRVTFKMPDQNGDIGDDNNIIIELVKAPKRED